MLAYIYIYQNHFRFFLYNSRAKGFVPKLTTTLNAEQKLLELMPVVSVMFVLDAGVQ